MFANKQPIVCFKLYNFCCIKSCKTYCSSTRQSQQEVVRANPLSQTESKVQQLGESLEAAAGVCSSLLQLRVC